MNRLRKKSGSPRKSVPQGLEPNEFTDTYGTDKSVPLSEQCILPQAVKSCPDTTAGALALSPISQRRRNMGYPTEPLPGRNGVLRMKVHLPVAIATNPDRSDVRIAGQGTGTAGGCLRGVIHERGDIGGEEDHMG